MNKFDLKIGTRGSNLALYQAYHIKELLEETYPEANISLEVIKTKGDKILDTALSKIGDKGLFTKELEVALEDGTIDIAVHSLKDMPTILPEGLKLGAVVKRGEVADALISRNGLTLEELNETHKIATSSLRRKANLLRYNPNFNIIDIRGNVNTRLKKMEDGYCDAMIMAATGLQRLGLDKYITQVLSTTEFIPAVSQGAIGIEMREVDEKTEEIIARINDTATWKSVVGERAFMRTLEGGCQVPVGCISCVDDGNYILKGFVASVDGSEYLVDELSGKIDESELIGARLGEKLISRGGKEILSAIRVD